MSKLWFVLSLALLNLSGQAAVAPIHDSLKAFEAIASLAANDLGQRLGQGERVQSIKFVGILGESGERAVYLVGTLSGKEVPLTIVYEVPAPGFVGPRKINEIIVHFIDK